MMTRPDPNNQYKVWRAASIAATVRRPWVLVVLAALAIGSLYFKLVAAALRRLFDIYTTWGSKRSGAARLSQVAGVCLVVIWIASLLLVFEYERLWLGFKVFSASTFAFVVLCELADWHEERTRTKQIQEEPEDINLIDIVSWHDEEKAERTKK